ncbi:MAG: hypothetical protein V4732_17075 [Pseudomonadota bacterium]
MDIKNKVKGRLVGLACGDAIGTTLEFRHRGTFDLVSDRVTY